ncbi:MAG: CoB--CoM heterodisulfide reductase iron-sulfur subunit A family protein [Candidatus Marinimicrobia bacterium]|nr:CoB--CoM heterodisulfide reductase iron-sulfur subunit A family protein [Candidatus Neomarinimicrobiota bacterium]
MKRIGVFVCHCGINIAATVDIESVVKDLEDYPGVVLVHDYKYMCSDPGQNMIKEKIKSERLDGIVVAACSPTLHENTFRLACKTAGMNPYNCEIANIREQCSWVHKNKDEATLKAKLIIKSIVEKALLDEELEPVKVPVIRKALVLGGGIAGIQAALSIANSGHEVILVERQSSIGGRMAQLSETFPTLDCSQCILTPKMVDVAQHDKIRLMTYSELEDISGFVGNFKVKIRQKAKYVDWDKCTGCGLCIEKCPKKAPSEFDQGLEKRKAVFTPFPQAVPNKPVIDHENCTYFKTGKCQLCKIVCSFDAVDFDETETFIEEEVGAIVVATGYDFYPVLNMDEYGSGKLPDVIDGLSFERILSASGPTGGEVRRPSDGTVPKEIVFIKCVGSRDPENHFPYCSKICCMYTTKHAMLYKHRVHDGQPYIFYMDVRAGGKGYEEFYQRAQEEDNVIFLRGKVSKVYQDDDKVVVCGIDTIYGRNVEIRADMVVLAMAIRPSKGVVELAKLLKIAIDQNGFLTEAHPKLRPVESLTAGIYLAGCAQAPKDIPDTVAQASATASMVSNLFSQEYLLHEPLITGVNEDLCSGCGVCVTVCPYDARKLNKEEGIVEVNEVLCEGCGSCSAACPSGAAQQKNFTDTQLSNMIKAILAE